MSEMKNKTSDFMDKQIMDLSNSHTNSLDHLEKKKNEIIPSYDFLPIQRPSSPQFHSSIFDTEEAPVRPWNSLDSKTNTSSLRNTLDAEEEPAKLTVGGNYKPVDAPLDVFSASEIDRIVKKHVDNLMHAMDGMSSRVTQLETRTRNLEHMVDDLKLSVENRHGDTDGKMRQLENILREVQTGVQFIRDKQEKAEAHFTKVEQVGNQNTMKIEHTHPGASPPPNAPPPPPQQNYQLPPPQQTYELPPPQQYPPNQVPSVPQQASYFPKHSQHTENLSQQFQQPSLQQPHHSPPPNQYPPTHQTLYSQPLPPSEPHLPFSTANSSLQPPSSHHPQEMQYSPSSRVPPHPSQQSYGHPSNVYDPPYMRPSPENSGLFGPSSADTTYPYGSSASSFSSGYPMKQHVSPHAMGQGHGGGFGQLPTARILPQALPTASEVESGSGAGGSGNKVPIDDVVDKVTNMGFPRDLVRATVRKLTENGQAVDLNVVLDKLMNDGNGQGPRGWYGR